MRKVLVLKTTGMLKAAVDDTWGLEKRDHQARTPDHSLRPISLWKVSESKSSRRCKQERPVLSL